MELKQIRTFYILAQESNFTRAAEKLGYTQANVTIQIKTLEEELRTPLFNRMGRRISLTEEGEKLLLLAARMLELEDSMAHIGDSRIDEGHIRIGVCDSLCVTRLPQIISGYKGKYPKVDITLNILKCRSSTRFL